MRFVIILFSLVFIISAALASSGAVIIPTPDNNTAVMGRDEVKVRNFKPRTQLPWRLPNGFEEYYMLLALHTSDRQWCDRMSAVAQIRKVDARRGVQAILWRNICLIEVAAATKNTEICRFIRGAAVDALDGLEFNAQYCSSIVSSRGDDKRPNFENLHWLNKNPFETRFLDAQGILRTLGFGENDLLTKEQQGLYQTVTRRTWSEYLFNDMLSAKFLTPNQLRPQQDKYDLMLKRSVNLPNFAASESPADRFLQYTGTTVRLPADCYENPTAEFSCRMLQCLSNSDLLTCRALGSSQDILQLRDVFVNKCQNNNKNMDKEKMEQTCKREVQDPYVKIFTGPPETFLPYLAR